MAEQITKAEAYERAKQQERKAMSLRAQAGSMLANAQRYERWAKRWRDWADDDYGDVPYPGRED